MTGTDVATYTRERPGMSAFVLEDGVVYHTYSAYARGLDGLWGMYQWLDRAPKGRNETGVWLRRHDEYDSPRQAEAQRQKTWKRVERRRVHMRIGIMLGGKHGRDTCAPPRQARPSRLDCELERTGEPDRVGGRDRRNARFRCRRRQRRRIVIIRSQRRPSPNFRGGCLRTCRAASSSVDIGNYHPELRDGRIDAIDRGMLDSQWVAQQIGRPVIKAFNNIFAKSLLEKGVPRGTRGGSLSRSPAIRRTPRQQCFASSTISASTLSTVVIWTTPGGSSPERRLTAGILKPLLSGARSPKPTGAGSQNTAPNRRLVSGGTSQRRKQAAQRVNEVLITRGTEIMAKNRDHPASKITGPEHVKSGLRPDSSCLKRRRC